MGEVKLLYIRARNTYSCTNSYEVVEITVRNFFKNARVKYLTDKGHIIKTCVSYVRITIMGING